MKNPRVVAAVVAVIAFVAVLAGVVSYGHIETLALAQHQTLTAARMYPLCIDGLIVAGSVILLTGSRLGWLGVVPGVAMTGFANIESGITWGWLAATVAVVPAIAFAVACFMLERWLKAQAGRGDQGGSRVVTGVAQADVPGAVLSHPVTTTEPVASQGGQGGSGWLTEPSAEDVSGAAADHPVTTTEPPVTTTEPPVATTEPPVVKCGHGVAGTVEEMIVNDYLHTRDCLGGTPSQRELAKRFDLSRPKVASLVGPLNGTHGGNHERTGVGA